MNSFVNLNFRVTLLTKKIIYYTSYYIKIIICRHYIY